MITLTAPTGRIGSKVLAGLLDQDEPVRVIARDPGKLPTADRERFEVVTGSHHDPDVLDRSTAPTRSSGSCRPPRPHPASTTPTSPPASPGRRRCCATASNAS